MKKRFAAFVSTVLAAVLCACSAAPKDVLPNKAAQPTEAPTQQAQTTQAAPTEQPTPEPDLVQQLLEEMTLEQKVGQLFLVRPDSLDLSQTQDQINDAKADGVTELTDAMRAIAGEVKAGTLQPEDINEKTIESHLYRDLPPVDLMIRTSGEERLSNFLLWQCAYSEFYFTPVLFPDFTKECFDKALEEYARRDRRMGGNTKK